MPIDQTALTTVLSDIQDPLGIVAKIEAQQYSQSLMGFVEAAWPIIEPGKKFKNNWHIEAIVEHLEAVSRREIKRLIINISPRCSKSSIVSVLFPIWTWTHDPSHQFLCGSYAEKLAIRDNLKHRRIGESNWYRERWGDKWHFTSDQNQKVRFENDQAGYRIAFGMTGGIMGDGGDCTAAGTIVITDLFGPIAIENIGFIAEPIKVLCYNHITHTNEYKLVEAFREIQNSKVVELETVSGKRLHLTKDHPVFDYGAAYCPAELLTRRSKLLLENGALDSVKAIRNVHESVNVYDIQVEDNHNFFANSILVHNCIIIDDPLDRAAAESVAERTTANDTYDGAIATRLNDPDESAVVVIMQRLHEDDLSGHLLLGEEEWDHLCIPMEWDDRLRKPTSLGWDDPRFDDGELMWPERFSAKAVGVLKERLGPYGAAGQLQQIPSPKGGGIIKLEYWREWPPDDYLPPPPGKPVLLPASDYTVAALDTAHTEKEENDPSALVIMGMWHGMGDDRPTRFSTMTARGPALVDETISSLPVPEADRAKIMLMHGWEKWLPLHGPTLEKPDGLTDEDWKHMSREHWGVVEWVIHSCRMHRVNKLLIEARSSGYQVAQELARLYANEPFSVELVEPRGDKVARVHSVQHIWANGQVHVPKVFNHETGRWSIPMWADKIMTQMSQFPKSAHDDLTDSAVYCVRHLRDIGLAMRTDEIERDWDEELRFRPKTKPLYDV